MSSCCLRAALEAKAKQHVIVSFGGACERNTNAQTSSVETIPGEIVDIHHSRTEQLHSSVLDVAVHAH